MLNVIDDISERNNVLHMRSYKSPFIGAKMLVIIIISDYQAHAM